MRQIIFKKIKKYFRESKFLSAIYGWLYYLKKSRIENLVQKELKSLRNLSSERLFKLQNEKLIRFLTYAYKNTEYYKNLFDSNDIDPTKITDFKKIPYLTKAIIRNNLKSLISKEYELSDLGKKNTGGSTGQPLEFYCDTNAGLIDNGHHWYLYSLMGHKKGDVILSCGGQFIPEELRQQNIYWIKRENGNVFGDISMSVLYISQSNIHLYIEKLSEIRPAILRGYPSFFDSLAQYILKNNIHLDFEIKGVNLTAEMCSAQQRENIENAFSSMVYFEYGHSEVSLYCYTYDNTYNYRSSPIYGYIEVLNDDGSETQVSEVGNIVATGFNNHGMPFIRYKTGDLGEVIKKNGGIVHFKTIYGRSQDYILTKDQQKIYLTALIFGQHLKAFAHITKWQIVQNHIGEIEILIVPADTYSKTDETDLEKKIKSVADIKIKFNYLKKIPRTQTGKHLFMIQNIKA